MLDQFEKFHLVTSKNGCTIVKSTYHFETKDIYPTLLNENGVKREMCQWKRWQGILHVSNAVRNYTTKNSITCSNSKCKAGLIK